MYCNKKSTKRSIPVLQLIVHSSLFTDILFFLRRLFSLRSHYGEVGKPTATITCALVLLCYTLVYAVVPQTINFQGRLTDTNGTPMGGTVNLTFGIFDHVSSSDTTSVKWGEGQDSVPLDNGTFNVMLGVNNPITSNVFDGGDRWIEIHVDGVKLTPRQKMGSVSYAFYSNMSSSAAYAVNAGTSVYATNADTVDGQHSSAFAATSHIHTPSQVSAGTFAAGDFTFPNNTIVQGSSITVTGNIVVGGTVDGVDISTITFVATSHTHSASQVTAGSFAAGDYTFPNNTIIQGSSITVTGNIVVGGTVDGVDISTITFSSQSLTSTNSWTGGNSFAGPSTFSYVQLDRNMQVASGVTIDGIDISTVAFGGGSGNVSLASTQTFTGSNRFTNYVGIGTTNPVVWLQVCSTGTNGGGGRIVIGDDYGDSGALNSYIAEYGWATVTDSDQLELHGKSGLYFTYDGVTGINSSKTAMMINSSGYVGISTYTPQTNLHISHTGDSAIFLEADTDNGATENDNAYIKLSQDNGAAQSILGLVGTAAFDPAAVAYTGTLANATLLGTLDSFGSLQLGTNDNVRMTILSTGFIGIGQTGATIDTLFDVRATNDECADFDRAGNDGVIVYFSRDNAPVGNITVSGGVVTLTAFTGSHYAWTDEKIERGMLVSLTGKNKYLNGDPQCEIIYGIKTSIQANDPAVLGSYLCHQEPDGKTVDDLHLIMAVGNGDMWVVDKGADLNAGDYLISSDISGHAMKDSDQYTVSHVIARAVEPVQWNVVTDTVNGIKHKKISVTFENFTKNKTVDIENILKEQNQKITVLEQQIKELQKSR